MGHEYRILLQKDEKGKFRIGDEYYSVTVSQKFDSGLRELQLKESLLVYAQQKVMDSARKEGKMPQRLELKLSFDM